MTKAWLRLLLLGQICVAVSFGAGCTVGTDDDCKECLVGWLLENGKCTFPGVSSVTCDRWEDVGAPCVTSDSRNQVILPANVRGTVCYSIKCKGRVEYALQSGSDFNTGCRAGTVSCTDGTCNILENYTFTMNASGSYTYYKMTGCGNGPGGFADALPDNRNTGSVLRLDTTVSGVLGAGFTLVWTCSSPSCPPPPESPVPTAADDDSNTHLHLVLIIIGCILLMILVFVLYQFFFKSGVPDRQEAMKDEMEKFEQMRRDRARDLNTSRTPKGSMGSMHSQYRSPDPYDNGSCEVQFRCGNSYRRGEIMSTLPDGDCMVRGQGSLLVRLNAQDVQRIGVLAPASDAEGYVASAATVPRVNPRDACPPSTNAPMGMPQVTPLSVRRLAM
eukprot:Rhum_TRINITY_DN21881_c0_g1::Rhum_TRINITY_DN21881_c0_g1_i1::g.174872::m.174872